MFQVMADSRRLIAFW